MNALLFTLLLVSPVACRSVPAEPVAFVLQNTTVATASGTGDGYTQITVEEDDKGELLLILHDKRVTALLDGEVLPAERIVREGDKLSVKAADGKVLYEVRVLDDTHSLIYPYDSTYYVTTTRGVNRFAPSGVTTIAAPTWGERRKLIGVTTSAVDPALRKQLGLQGDVFMIETVNDDMPAQRAGAEPYDIVTAIDGDPGASGEKLREVLDEKEPGQTLTLTVLRAGKTLDLALTVEEPRATGVSWPKVVDAQGGWPQATVWRDAAESEAELAELLKRSAELDGEREQVTRALAELQAQTGGADAANTDAARRLTELAAQQDRVKMAQADIEADLARRAREGALLQQGAGGSRWLMLPSGQASAGGVAVAGGDDRLKLMEERLARLEELLERLAARQPAAAPPAEAPAQKP